jgi:uncharacterized protein YbjT (DUF2867 family)
MVADPAARSALVVGATGLVGRECVRRLAGDARFERVMALARRALPDDVNGPSVRTILADFDRLDLHPDAFRVTHVFCALGTTIKAAGSRERFREVDFGYPVRIGELARAAGADHFLLVSSMGADPRSRVFYTRVKGEVERAIIGLGFPSVTIVRPSLLLGDRKEFRLGEVIAQRLAWTFPPKYRAVHVREVARVMVRAAVEDRVGVRVIENREIGRETGNDA